MKKLFIFFAAALIALSFYSCKNSDDNKKPYVDPVYKENLTEIYNMIAKKYTFEYDELLQKWGTPGMITKDTITDANTPDVIDSTISVAYPKYTFHFYKSTLTQKIRFTGIEITGELKTSLFTLDLGAPEDDIKMIFGDPIDVVTTRDEKKSDQVITRYKYGLLIDDSGNVIDTFIFTLIDNKYKKMEYILSYQPTEQDQQNLNDQY